MPTYVILTSKPGQFHSLPAPSMQPIERYEYVAQQRVRASFVIAELSAETKFAVIDDTPPPVTNHVPTKFLDHFSSLDEARRELNTLTGPVADQGQLKRIPLEDS